MNERPVLDIVNDITNFCFRLLQKPYTVAPTTLLRICLLELFPVYCFWHIKSMEEPVIPAVDICHIYVR